MSNLCVTISPFEKSVQARSGDKLYDLNEDYDLGILFGCRQGACGSCRIQILSPLESVSPMDEEEREFLTSLGAEVDERLACQCRVVSDVTFKIYDERG